MSIKQRLVDNLADTVAERKANPPKLSLVQQQLTDALLAKEALLKEIVELQSMSPEEHEAMMEAKLTKAKHETAVMRERLKIVEARANKAPAPPTKTATEFVAPSGMSAVEAAILKFTLGEMA